MGADDMLRPLPLAASDPERAEHYQLLLSRLELLLEGEDDWVACMATVSCELHHAFAYFHWTGFYRARCTADPGGGSGPGSDEAPGSTDTPGTSGAPGSTDTPGTSGAPGSDDAPGSSTGGDAVLVIGPYQGSHGCLRIPFSRGVCGAAARYKQTQLVRDVHTFPGHIACASSTQSEVVVPVLTQAGKLLAVLDVDSDNPAAFTVADQQGLERLCGWLGGREWKMLR